jgi:hypothetical protein
MVAPCPNCHGRKIVFVAYGGIGKVGQQVCAVCRGAGVVTSKPKRTKRTERIITEGPEPD